MCSCSLWWPSWAAAALLLSWARFSKEAMNASSLQIHRQRLSEVTSWAFYPDRRLPDGKLTFPAEVNEITLAALYRAFEPARRGLRSGYCGLVTKSLMPRFRRVCARCWARGSRLRRPSPCATILTASSTAARRPVFAG